jgi:hypothetical protein
MPSSSLLNAASTPSEPGVSDTGDACDVDGVVFFGAGFSFAVRGRWVVVEEFVF